MSDIEDEDEIVDLEEEIKFISLDDEYPSGREPAASTSSTLSTEDEPQALSFEPVAAPPASHLDSEYLKQHLGLPLTLALADIAKKCPSDPINYLAHWLMRWRWNQEHKQRQHDKLKELEAEKERLHQQRLQAEMKLAKQTFEEFYADKLELVGLMERAAMTGDSVSAQRALLQDSEGNTVVTENAQLSGDEDDN